MMGHLQVIIQRGTYIDMNIIAVQETYEHCILPANLGRSEFASQTRDS